MRGQVGVGGFFARASRVLGDAVRAGSRWTTGRRPRSCTGRSSTSTDLFPTAAISRGSGPARTCCRGPRPLEDGRRDPARRARHDGRGDHGHDRTDGWIVLHGRSGRWRSATRRRDAGAETRHILMSVSKSLVGIVAAALVASGVLDPADDPVTALRPGAGGSGYAGATVRHLLDMRSGIRVLRGLPRPGGRGPGAGTGHRLGATPAPAGPGTRCTTSCSTLQAGSARTAGRSSTAAARRDVLGWICEAAAGERMPELMSRLLWSRLGAEDDADIAVDCRRRRHVRRRDLRHARATWPGSGDGRAGRGTR